MFQSISWQEFIIALASLTAAYYLVATLVFYRKEIANLVKKGSRYLRGDRSTSIEKEEDASMIGSTAKSGDQSMLANYSQESSEELSYAPADELPDPVEEAGSVEADAEQQVFVGTISDLLEEIKAVCGAITDSVATNQEATALFEALLSRFRELKDTPYQSSINDHIYSVTREPFLVNFSREEIEAFWDNEA